jgi:hypothetical protein
MYCDQSFKFKGNVFKHFKELMKSIDDIISMRWITYLNNEIDYLVFELGGNTFEQGRKIMPLFKFLFQFKLFTPMQC